MTTILNLVRMYANYIYIAEYIDNVARIRITDRPMRSSTASVHDAIWTTRSATARHNCSNNTATPSDDSQTPLSIALWL